MPSARQALDCHPAGRGSKEGGARDGRGSKVCMPALSLPALCIFRSSIALLLAANPHRRSSSFTPHRPPRSVHLLPSAPRHKPPNSALQHILSLRSHALCCCLPSLFDLRLSSPSRRCFHPRFPYPCSGEVSRLHSFTAGHCRNKQEASGEGGAAETGLFICGGRLDPGLGGGCVQH